MDYKDKIKYLEKRISELDIDLKKTISIVQENRDSINDLAQNINSYTLQARQSIEDTDKLIALNKIEEAEKKVAENSIRVTKAETLIESLVVLYKRGIMNNLEKYHKHNSIIRQITPKVSEDISKKIQEFEKDCKDLLKFYSSLKLPADLNKLTNRSLDATKS